MRKAGGSRLFLYEAGIVSNHINSRLKITDYMGKEDGSLNQDILNSIQEADCILIGIGEEFEELRKVKSNPEYIEKREGLKEADHSWCMPVLNQLLLYGKEDVRNDALQNLVELLKGKNYFVISTITSSCIRNCGLDQNRVVSPCGGVWSKQCDCSHQIKEMSGDELNKLEKYILCGSGKTFDLGVCPECGGAYILNNIFADQYNENGYMDQWKKYTSWLQSTLNHRLLVLELGVGMEYPTVIRWPFEKAVYYNQKAALIRVNKKLYHLTEEIKERGRSVAQNAVDWLAELL